VSTAEPIYRVPDHADPKVHARWVANAIADLAAGTCMWFAGCTNEADGTEAHPVLGDVPICGRCAERVRAA
jgi:hypothetical protein